MPNLEWTIPHKLHTPQGELLLNVTDAGTLRRYQLTADYKIVPTLRVTQDNLSQMDGSVPHPRWKTGLVASLSLRYMIMVGGVDDPTFEPACGADLREMHDELMRHLDSIRALSSVETQRLFWTPTGYGGEQRLLDDILLLAWSDPVRDDLGTGVNFQLETPFPYAIDFTEHADAISSTHTITNAGSADFKPVVEVTAATDFTIINESVLDDLGNPLQLVYDDGLPGAVAITGSDYAEIDFFRGTIFLNGNGAELIAGINPLLSDFFPLAKGDNNIVVSGTTATFKWNNAWS